MRKIIAMIAMLFANHAFSYELDFFSGASYTLYRDDFKLVKAEVDFLDGSSHMFDYPTCGLSSTPNWRSSVAWDCTRRYKYTEYKFHSNVELQEVQLDELNIQIGFDAHFEASYYHVKANAEKMELALGIDEDDYCFNNYFDCPHLKSTDAYFLRYVLIASCKLNGEDIGPITSFEKFYKYDHDLGTYNDNVYRKKEFILDKNSRKEYFRRSNKAGFKECDSIDIEVIVGSDEPVALNKLVIEYQVEY